MEGTGFEPVYAKRSDLQSDGFNHSPTPPHFRVGTEALSRFVGRFMVGCRKGVNTLRRLSSKKLVQHAFCGKLLTRALASAARFALIGAGGFALRAGIAQW